MNIRPSDDLLAQFAPLEIWRLAEAQAERSPAKNFRTGAVIFEGGLGNKHFTICSTGCSHPHDGGRKVLSIHAEAHAIKRMPSYYGRINCMIVTLTKANNYATNSRPCYGCATALKGIVWKITYAELCNDNTWAIRCESPFDLLSGYLKETKYEI